MKSEMCSTNFRLTRFFRVTFFWAVLKRPFQGLSDLCLDDKKRSLGRCWEFLANSDDVQKQDTITHEGSI